MNLSALSRKQSFWLGASHILPLCLAVLPWGILAGSMAINHGFSPLQSIGMSALIFAGAAQLVTISMVAAGSGFIAICLTIFVITAQHLLYGLILREHIACLPIKKRLSVAFLLTDELFALSAGKKIFNFSYLLGAGFCFYLAWIVFTGFGVVLASSVSNLADYHLDFSIVATFIAIVVPMIKRLSTLVGVVVSLTLSLVLTSMEVNGAVVMSGLLGMLSGVFVARLTGEEL